MATMTDKQAYVAMFHFLEQYYARTNSDDVGAMLGGMSRMADGRTADPAVDGDWREAVDFALQGGEESCLQLPRPEGA